MALIYQKKFSFTGRTREIEAEISEVEHDTYRAPSKRLVYLDAQQLGELIQHLEGELRARPNVEKTYSKPAINSVAELKTALSALNTAPSSQGASLAQHSGGLMKDGTYSTQQATSKSIKGQMVLAWLLGLLGVVVFSLSISSGNDGGAGIGGLLILAGAAWFFFLKIRRWWEHG